jgi:hypothetical protein
MIDESNDYIRSQRQDKPPGFLITGKFSVVELGESRYQHRVDRVLRRLTSTTKQIKGTLRLALVWF